MYGFCRSYQRWFWTTLVGLAASATLNGASAADVAVDTVLQNLHRPTALAVRPGGTADRFELFIAEGGTGRVVRWTNLIPETTHATIDGFDVGEHARVVEHRNPLALLFVDAGLLAVGKLSTNGHGVVGFFELPDKGEPLPANKSREQLVGQPGDLACSALARTRVNEFVADQLILVVRRAHGRNALCKSRIQAGTAAEIHAFPNLNKGRTWQAVASSPTGRIVAVGKAPLDRESELVFINPIDGSIELEVALDLPKVVSLAYSPTTGNLYIADFELGVFRVDDVSRPGRPACKAIRVTDLHHPTALAFAPDGALYATTSGDQSDHGTLLVFTGSL